MIRVPTFGKLVRVGLPSAFRGEIWEASSGAMYLRFANRDLYSEILEKYKDQRSTSTEEIEKDLNRSLPEYPGYQTEEGLNRLRRVLTAYSWNNPELGYCQAMNIVTSALLIYTTEEQAFWILHVLVDRMCPGYYSTNMYGALLDQIIFEKLVERTMPLLWNHFKKTNVELSVACLPWFLSLYINSMPLEYAVRVLDMLFMEGPRILFQIGLAILKLNGEELLKSGDDGSFLDVLKSFFQSMGVKELIEQDRAESVKSTYREFSLITDEMITELRSENQLKVGAGIESFTKRTIIRHLKDTAGFTKEEIAILYDKFYGALYYANHEVAGKSESSMNQEIFHSMLASMTLWAKNKSSEDSIDVKAAQEVSSRFIERLYISFAGSKDAFIDFQKMIIGMNEILHGDIMSHLDWFFDLYDEDDLQMLTSKNIIDMSKELYWLISVLRDTDIAWDAVTNLIVQSCEQSDVAKGGQPDEATLMHRLADLTMKASSYSFHSRIKQLENSIIADLVDLTIPSFRMVALTNETLEMFFDYGFKNSFKLVKSAADRQKSLVREVFENLFEDGQKLAEETPSQSSISREKSSNSLAQIDSSPPITKSPSGQDVKLDEEVDTLINEMDTFDVWSN
ncbi:rab-GTPase-TBC domain-containing protein [Pilobolus umbonatus]|nr:rab-GTPase-TBC domain-containing protein [Pilobolus umbonatus]